MDDDAFISTTGWDVADPRFMADSAAGIRLVRSGPREDTTVSWTRWRWGVRWPSWKASTAYPNRATCAAILTRDGQPIPNMVTRRGNAGEDGRWGEG